MGTMNDLVGTTSARLVQLPDPRTPIKEQMIMAPTTALYLVPTETDLFPHLGKDETCIYCGIPQTDEQAEQRTFDHVARDLAEIHRIREALRTEFDFEAPGYDADVYDLLCELATATEAPALAETAVAR